MHACNSSGLNFVSSHSTAAAVQYGNQWKNPKWPHSFATDVRADPRTAKGIAQAQDGNTHHTAYEARIHTPASTLSDHATTNCHSADVSNHSKFLEVLDNIQNDLKEFPTTLINQQTGYMFSPRRTQNGHLPSHVRHRWKGFATRYCPGTFQSELLQLPLYKDRCIRALPQHVAQPRWEHDGPILHIIGNVQPDAQDEDQAGVAIYQFQTPCLHRQPPMQQILQKQQIRCEDACYQPITKVCFGDHACLKGIRARNSDGNAQPSVQTHNRSLQCEAIQETSIWPWPHVHDVAHHDQHSSMPLTPPRPVKAGTSNRISFFPTLQCRLEHESPIAAFAARLPDDDTPGNREPHGQHPNVPVQPAFVDDLSTRLAPMGYDVWDPDFDVPVRTWYIDHATIRRWTAPRNLQLVGPPRGWEAQFSSLWVDQINPDEWFDVTVIYPDPPRTPRNSFLIMDLVVTQSLQLDRFPGLITVFPTMHEAFELFSVAASFEPHVSGFDIAQAADAADMCRYQECTVTFGWQEIPFTLRPQHVMAYGDGFQLVVRHQPARLMMSSSSQAGSTADSSIARAALPDAGRRHVHEQPHDASPAQRFMTPLHVFQLEGHEVVIQLVNAQLAQPTNAMAQALHVPLNCIEALHIMPIAPDGFPELAIPAIVQRVGDLDLHSTDRLILIDTIYHHHPDPSGLTNRPTVVRAVQRVSCQITRQQILFKAAVYHYCQFLQEGCAVSLDGYLWPINHVDPRPVTHGSYATVDVPPPYGHQLDTRMVADQLHDDGTMNTMMNWLTEPDDTPDDTMQLMQVLATTRVVNAMTKHHIRRVCQDCPLPSDAGVTDYSESPSAQLTEPHEQCYPRRHESSAFASHLGDPPRSCCMHTMNPMQHPTVKLCNQATCLPNQLPLGQNCPGRQGRPSCITFSLSAVKSPSLAVRRSQLQVRLPCMPSFPVHPTAHARNQCMTTPVMSYTMIPNRQMEQQST